MVSTMDLNCLPPNMLMLLYRYQQLGITIESASHELLTLLYRFSVCPQAGAHVQILMREATIVMGPTYRSDAWHLLLTCPELPKIMALTDCIQFAYQQRMAVRTELANIIVNKAEYQLSDMLPGTYLLASTAFHTIILATVDDNQHRVVHDPDIQFEAHQRWYLLWK